MKHPRIITAFLVALTALIAFGQNQNVTVDPSTKALKAPNPLYLGNGAQLIGNTGSTVDLRNSTVILPSSPTTVPNVVSVATVAALRGTTVSGLPNGAYVQTSGYAGTNDGGGGIFIYNSGSAAADDGGLVVAPTVGSGRWLRNYSGDINARWFGAKGDGITDDTTAIQNTIAAAYSNHVGAVYLPAGTYLVTTRLRLYEGMAFHGEDFRDNVDAGVIPASGTSIYFTPAVANTDFMLVQANAGAATRCPFSFRQIKLVAMNTNARDAFVLQSCEQATLERVYIIAQSGASWSGYGAHIYSALDLTLTRVFFYKCLGAGATFASGSAGVSTTVRFNQCGFELNTNDILGTSYCNGLVANDCIFESSSGDSVVAGCPVTLINPYFEDVTGRMLAAGVGSSPAVAYVRVIGGTYVDGGSSDKTKDAFFLDAVNMAYLDVGTSWVFKKGALLRSTANTGQIIWFQPYNTISFGGSARANSTPYAKGDEFTIVDSGVTYHFQVTTAGTSAGSQPGGYGRTTYQLTDGTMVVNAVDTAVPYNLGQYTATNAGSQGGAGLFRASTFQAFNGYLGTTSGTPIGDGLIGEEQRTTTNNTAPNLANTTATNIATLLLPKGQWDVSANIHWNPAGTTSITVLAGAISEVSATLPPFASGLPNWWSYSVPASVPANLLTGSIGPIRIISDGTTVVYLVAYAGFSVSTLQAFGTIRAVRAG